MDRHKERQVLTACAVAIDDHIGESLYEVGVSRRVDSSSLDGSRACTHVYLAIWEPYSLHMGSVSDENSLSPGAVAQALADAVESANMELSGCSECGHGHGANKLTITPELERAISDAFSEAT